MKYNIDALISILGGLYVYLAAKGHVMISKNPESNHRWVQKYGSIMKIIGPMVMVFGILNFFKII